MTGPLDKPRRSIFATLGECAAMLPAPMRWRWAALIPLSLLTGIVEAGAAAGVFALIKIIGNPDQINHIRVAAKVLRILPGLTPRGQLLLFTGLLALYYVVKNLLVIGTQYLRHKIGGESNAELKSTMLRGYLFAPYPFHLRRNSADLISNTNFCVEMVCTEAMEAAVAAGSELLTAAAISVVLLVMAPKVTLIASGFLLLLLAVLLRLTRRMAEYYGTQRHQLERASLQTLQEALGAIKEVKTLGREYFFYSRFRDQQLGLVKLGYIARMLETMTPPITETIFICGALLVIALITGIGQTSAQSAPLLGLFAYAAFRVVPAANRVGWRINQVRGAAPSVHRLYQDYILVAAAVAKPGEPQQRSARFHQRLVLDHVSYTFAGAQTAAVQDISLTIEFGQSVGIVGSTGAGKTTLVDLVAGLLQPACGRILIDGEDLSGRLSAWKRDIGYVPQTIFLIDDTLRRNIALGIEGSEIDEDRLRTAIRIAQLERLIAELPLGLETTVGERGVRLSGGERQRVGIARALYHDPGLLIFDEATSALDHATEAAVSQAIEALHGKKTLLVVAHRLSSVRRCDRLVFMSESRIRACGSYDDLLRDYPEFRRMVRAQDHIDPLSN
jgi:ABC-type multidrug transport system fused ATPase/permease subunit